jgi:hypothetical protein
MRFWISDAGAIVSAQAHVNSGANVKTLGAGRSQNDLIFAVRVDLLFEI